MALDRRRARKPCSTPPSTCLNRAAAPPSWNANAATIRSCGNASKNCWPPTISLPALERPLAVDPGETSAPKEQPAVTGAAPAAVPGKTGNFRLASPSPDALIGSIIAGRYQLRQEIGEGGLGSVYLAEQTQPVKRHVAVKLIKPRMDSRRVRAPGSNSIGKPWR